MSAAVRSPPHPNNSLGWRPSTPPAPTLYGARSQSPSRPSTPSTIGSTTNNGLAKTKSARRNTGSPISARAAVRKPATATMNGNAPYRLSSGAEEDAKAETAALVEELKESLRKAETASEEYQKQLAVLHIRLDESMLEQSKLEEKYHENEERIEVLDNETKENVRQRRELEEIYEAERSAWIREKEEATAREESLQEALQRLKKTTSHRNSLRAGFDDKGLVSRSPSFHSRSSTDFEDDHFAPSLQRSESRSDSKLVLQKDKVIESLRLELAEAQIKVVEVENMGSGRFRQLERFLLEARMTNARLREENEGFQLLLSEKTLNGDFSKSELMCPPSSFPRRPSSRGDRPSNLADELESAANADLEHLRRVEAELDKLKDENKALTLYINNIIGRLLQHNGFEKLFDKTAEQSSGDIAADANFDSKDEDLPPPPMSAHTNTKDPDIHNPEVRSPAPSLLQRAKSVVARPRPRPTSYISASTAGAQTTSAHEDPESNPTGSLSRSGTTSRALHRRADSEWSAGAIVNNMYRGPPPNISIPATGQLSQGLVSPRSSFFTSAPNTMTQQPSRMPSASSITSVNSTAYAHNSNIDALDSPNWTPNPKEKEMGRPGSSAGESENKSSPPRSVAGSAGVAEAKVMAGNRPRPLRLVQENRNQGQGGMENGVVGGGGEEEGGKKANRGSWMGWWGKGKAKEGDGDLAGVAVR